jgi:hypothetical protein
MAGGRAERCEACRFWEDVGEGYGHCHRLPPVPLGSGESTLMTAWPETKADDWCGEFFPRPGVPPADEPVGSVLSVRAANVVRGLGAKTVADLASLSHRRIADAPRSSHSILGEVVDVLGERGLSLRPEPRLDAPPPHGEG